MSEAVAFQSWFAGAITADRAPRQVPPSFAVYRNTWLKGLLDALDASYPTVAMILGADLFKDLAVRFARDHPAATPVLALYGDGFADFLANDRIGRDIPYLPEVALLDRLWTECFFAPDAAVLHAQRLAVVTSAELLRLRLRLHPATRFARFETPAVTIWQAHRASDDFEEIEPAWKPEHALVTRRGMSIAVTSIGEPTRRLLAEIQAGKTIGEAIGAAGGGHNERAVADALTTIISSAALAAPTAEDVRIW